MKILYIRTKHLIITIIIIIILIIVVGFLSVEKQESKQVFYLPITNKIIAIDPGHGGPDPGKVSKSGLMEDELNLEIALNLKRLIEQSGGIVIMTRETEDGLHSPLSKTLREMKREDLHKRKEIVDENESHIFISIHLNSFTKPNYHGAQTFYKKDSQEGEKLALIIQESLKNILDPDNHREPQDRDDIFLLNEIEIPSVLIECGFLSNEREAQLLADELYQEKIAWSIYIGIMNYFNQLENELEF